MTGTSYERALIDENLPVQLHRWLGGIGVRSIAYMGRKGVSNGELPARMAGEFDVLLTADHPLAAENAAVVRTIGVVIVPTNRERAVERLVPDYVPRSSASPRGNG